MEFNNRAVVVTGAGQNVGQKVAAEFAAEGAHVVVVDLDDGRGRAAADEVLSCSSSGGVEFVRCDVTNESSVVAMFRGLEERGIYTDILVNCVAMTDRGRSLLDTDLVTWERTNSVCLSSAFLCTREAAKQMIATERPGSIVNIGSTSAHRPRANAAAYAAAKAGLISFSRSSALQLAPYGIRVNMVTPNKVGSPVGKSASGDRKPTNLVGRSATVADIANAVLFMASSKASFIDGEELIVDGGALWAAAAD